MKGGISEIEAAGAELVPGETLVWCGRPDYRLSSTSSAMMLGVTLVCCLFALWCLANALDRNSAGGAVVATLFAGFAALLILRSWRVVIEPKRTLYALTDRRLIVVRGRGLVSVQRSALRQIELVRHRHSVTLRIPTVLVSDSEGGQRVDFLELRAVQDGLALFRLLIQTEGYRGFADSVAIHLQ